MSSEVWREALPRIIAGLVIIGALLLALVLVQLRQVIVVLFLAGLIGISLNPLVDALARYRVPRAVSVLSVYVLVGAVLGAVVYFAAVQVQDQTLQLEFEEIKADYEEFREGTVLPPADDIERRLGDVASRALTGVLEQAITVVSAILFVFTTLFTALLFTLTQERIRERLLDFIPPDERPRTYEVMHKLAYGLRHYVIAELVAMSTIGLVTYVGLLIIGVKLPLALAAVAFLGEAFPIVGPSFAAIPALAVALLTGGVLQFVQVAILYLIIQGFENYVVTPVVHARESKVPALLIFVALLIGGTLMGILGALIAVPLAVLLHILYFEFVPEWNARRFDASDATGSEDAEPRQQAAPEPENAS